MASFTKAKKSFQKNHKERSQLKSRNKLGLLEKHKDYVLRAKDYHSKQDRLKWLREKALNKNPDEFYFKMVHTRTKDGVHVGQKRKEHSAAQLKIMKSQDLNYVNLKHGTEVKKIEKLQSSLQLAGTGMSQPVNQHIVFVESRSQASKFDAAEYFDTAPELVSRTFNRPTMKVLQEGKMATTSALDMESLEEERNKKYEELKQRIDREEEMQNVAQRMQMQKYLMGKGPRMKVQDKKDNKPAIYKWKKQRKR